MQKIKKKFQKTLDIQKAKWYNIQAVARKREWAAERSESKKIQKKIEKGIDKRGTMWYNRQAAEKKAANGHWKLNNKREVQSIVCAKYKSLQRVIYTQTSKRS